MNTLGHHLPQSEQEWLQTGYFTRGNLLIGHNKIQYAIAQPQTKATGQLAIMLGGIPRNQERQQKLPLINKLYGRLAILLANQGTHSLLYSHPGTGKSTGSLHTETTRTRIDTLTNLAARLADRYDADKVTLVGMSAGSYIAARAVEPIGRSGLKVNKLVLQSPAAYPVDIEDIPYGSRFSSIIRSKWNTSESSVFADIEKSAKNGTNVIVSYFQRDDPPIPSRIQRLFLDQAAEMISQNLPVTAYTIYGVEHNFRRIGSNHSGNIVNNNAVRATAEVIADFIDAY